MMANILVMRISRLRLDEQWLAEMLLFLDLCGFLTFLDTFLTLANMYTKQTITIKHGISMLMRTISKF
ncbi:hypothetical protein BpHYR1_028977 [Brachionus plicatilis]|uniref:Uncharacterized protein n=1 Tax=Brachionus plicatilis TaxID=10195 RepID=A0A3M7RUE2_BRAPC|nr:hypothetical protein BpHYR1_028977 [Brachionus plicatilis]